MNTLQELIAKYEKYTDDELLEMQANLHDYSDEAKEAFRTIILKRGGEENLAKIRDRKIVLVKECRRIVDAVNKMTTSDIDISFLKKMISSDILGQSELDSIIESSYQKARAEIEDTEIKSNTIFGSIFGGIVASIIGGVFFGLQLIYSRRIFVILIIGLVLLCYWIVYLFTRKSYKNPSVSIATVLASVFSIILGKLLFLLFGYHGPIEY